MPEPSRRRWLRALPLAGVAAGAIALTALGADPVARALAGPAARALSDLLGEDVQLGAVRISGLRGTFDLEGVVVSHRSDDAARHGAPILVADRVGLRLGWRGAWPGIAALEIERPQIRLHRDEDGLRELRRMRLKMDGSLDRFPWDEAHLRGGSARVEGPRWSVQLDGIDLRPEVESGRSRLQIARTEIVAGPIQEILDPIDLRDLRIRPQALELPVGALRGPRVQVEGGFALGVGAAPRADLRAALDLGLVDPALPDPFGAEGQLRWTAVLTGDPGGPLRASGGLSLPDARLTRTFPEGPAAPLDLSGIALAWALDGRQLALGPAWADWGGGHVELRGAVDLETRQAQLGIWGDALHLRDVLRQVGVHPHAWVDFDADLRATLEGTLSPLQLSGDLSLAARRLRVDAGPADTGRSRVLDLPRVDAEGHIDIIGRDVLLRLDRLSTPRSRARLWADLALGPSPAFDIRARLEGLGLDEIAPLGGVELAGRARGDLRVHGPAGRLRVDAQLEVDGLGVQGFHLADTSAAVLRSPDLRTLELRDFRAVRGRTPWTGALTLDFRPVPLGMDLQIEVLDGRLADLIGVAVEVPGLDAGVRVSADLQGPWNRMTGPIDGALVGVDLFGEPFDQGRFTAEMVDGQLWIDQLSVERSGGASLLARGRVGQGRALNLDLHGSGLSLQTSALLAAAELPLTGDLSLDAHIGGRLEAPAPAGRLAVRAATWKGRPLPEGTLYFDTIGPKLRFEGPIFGDGFGVQGEVALDGSAEWSLMARMADIVLDPVLPAGEGGVGWRAGLRGRVLAEGSPGHVDVDTRIDAITIGWDQHQLSNPDPWRLRFTDGVLALPGVRLEGGQTRLRVDGGLLRGGAIEIQGQGEVDLDLLRAVVPGLTRAVGVARVDATVEGTVDDPAPSAVVALSGATLKGDWFPQAFEEISGQVFARPDEYALRGVRGRLGGGSWTAEGRVEALGWRPTRYALSARVDDARVRYLDFLPPIVGDADLRFDGPADALLLGGSIQIDEMVFAERIDWEDWVLEFSGDRLLGASEEAGEDLFDLDLRVAGDRTVRFRNNVGDLVASADLRFVGDTARPGMTGEIRAVPGGRALMKEREFEIQRAEIRFTDPYTYDPELDFALETRVRTRDADFLVDYRVLGPYSDWHTETRSEPALPQADINSLLLFGLTTEQMARYGGAAGALAVEGGDLLASKFGLVERVGQGVYGLDLIRPERIDLVSGVSERSSGAVSSELRLLVEKDLDWATLIFEQNLSRRVDTFVGFEKRLARLLYVRTYWGRDQVGRRLDIGGAYGLELNVRAEVD